MTGQNNQKTGVIFSFQQFGKAMKVSAFCEETSIEVSLIVPTSLNQDDMQLLALRKLKMRLAVKK